MKRFALCVWLFLFKSVVLGQGVIDLREDTDFVITGEEIGYFNGLRTAKLNDNSIIVGDAPIHVYSRAGVYRYEYTPAFDAGRLRSRPNMDAFGDLAVFGFQDASSPSGQGYNLIGRAFVLNTRTGEQLLDLTFDHVEAGIPNKFWANSVSINDQYVAMGEQHGRAVVHDVNTGEEVFRFIPDTIDSPKSGDLDLYEHYIAINSPDAVTDGVHSPGIFLFDVITGEQEAKIAGEFSNVELGADRIFIRSSEENSILGYNFSGDLVSQFNYESLGETIVGETRDVMEYEAPYVLASRDIFNAEDLSFVARVEGGALRDVVGRQVLGSFQSEVDGVGRVPFLTSFAIPEPTESPWLAFLGVVLCLRRRTRQTCWR